MTIYEAIGREEGIREAGSRAQRNNNPGNIEWTPWTQAHGADRIETIPEGIHETPRFAHFPTLGAGYLAMRDLLLISAGEGLSVAQALKRWAPPTENDTSAYVTNVCAWVGCHPTDLIGPLLVPLGELADAV